MTPYRLALLVLLVCVLLTGCGSSSKQEQAGAASGQELEGCNAPPRFIEWSNSKYELKTMKDEAAEPGMKLGYLACKDGVYTQIAESENAVFNIYSNGNPSLTHELIYLGEWGYAVYKRSS